jgi:hypothetical protein
VMELLVISILVIVAAFLFLIGLRLLIQPG